MRKQLEKVQFSSPEGCLLAGVLHIPADPERTGVVVCHGMFSGKDSPKLTELSKRVCALGHAALRFDFSGRGESQGDLLDLTFRRQVDECKTAVDFLKSRGFDRIGLLGSSMGGAVVILTAASNDIVALATLAAIGNADKLMERVVSKQDVATWKREGSIVLEGERVGWSLAEESYGIDILGAADKIECPWLILHGQNDEVVPVTDAYDLNAASNERTLLEVIKDADHKFSDDRHRRQVIEHAVDFLHRSLSGCSA